jgi:hypothetical protein
MDGDEFHDSSVPHWKKERKEREERKGYKGSWISSVLKISL